MQHNKPHETARHAHTTRVMQHHYSQLEFLQPDQYNFLLTPTLYTPPTTTIPLEPTYTNKHTQETTNHPVRTKDLVKKITDALNKKYDQKGIMSYLQNMPLTQEAIAYFKVGPSEVIDVFSITAQQCQPHTFNNKIYKKLYQTNPLFKAAAAYYITTNTHNLKNGLDGTQINNITEDLQLPVQIRTTITQELLKKFTTYFALPTPTENLNGSVAICDKTHQAATPRNNNLSKLVILDLTKNIIAREIQLDDRNITSYCFNQPGTHLATANNTNTVTIYDPHTGQKLKNITFKHAINSVYFTKKQHILVALCDKITTSLCLPDKKSVYKKPERLEITGGVFSNLPSKLYHNYDTFDRTKLEELTKIADYNFSFCYHAAMNETNINNLTLITHSTYFEKLTPYEKQYIQSIINQKQVAK
jgi:hypothetical protein